MYPLIIGLLLLAGVSVQNQPAQQTPAQQTDKQQAATAPATKVGKETCLTCHDIAADFSHNPHAKQECEACHGPGSTHVDSGGDDKSVVSFKAHPPKWANQQCLACHGDHPDVSGFFKSAHGRNGLSCISCHEIHPAGVRFSLLKTKEQSLCIGCHQTARADFQKPFHHPVLEETMKCSNCHSPHQENLRPNLRRAAGSPQACVACHSDKRGPFVFEHVPVRVNSCESCHEPHGAMNGHMLRRNEVHQLCLECHSMTTNVLTAQPPAFHDIRSPRFRQCTVCHRQIHGSNADPVLLK